MRTAQRETSVRELPFEMSVRVPTSCQTDQSARAGEPSSASGRGDEVDGAAEDAAGSLSVRFALSAAQSAINRCCQSLLSPRLVGSEAKVEVGCRGKAIPALRPFARPPCPLLTLQTRDYTMAGIEQLAQNAHFGGVIRKYSSESKALGGLKTQFNVFLPKEALDGEKVPCVDFSCAPCGACRSRACVDHRRYQGMWGEAQCWRASMVGPAVRFDRLQKVCLCSPLRVWSISSARGVARVAFAISPPRVLTHVHSAELRCRRLDTAHRHVSAVRLLTRLCVFSVLYYLAGLTCTEDTA